MRFFSPPEKPTLRGALQHLGIHFELLGPLLHVAHEVGGRQLGLASRLALGIHGGLEERHGGDAGDLDRVLEGQEQALGGADLGVHVQHVLAVEQHLALGHLIIRATRDDVRERRLAGPVRPHDGGDLTGVDLEVEPAEDLLTVHFDVEIPDFEHAFGPYGRLNLKALPPPAHPRGSGNPGPKGAAVERWGGLRPACCAGSPPSRG